MKHLYGLLPIATSLWAFLGPVHAATLSIPYRPLCSNPSSTQSLNAINLNTTSNLTSLSDPADPLFGFIPFFEGPTLNENYALLTSIDAAFRLGLDDFYGSLGPTVFMLEGYSSVQITIVPAESARAGKFPRKFAVWGLNIGIDLMIRTANFQSALFLLTYFGRAIGSIKYSKAGRHVAASEDDLEMMQPVAFQNSPSIPPDNRTVWLEESTNKDVEPSSEIGTIGSKKDAELRIVFTLFGKQLNKYAVFYAALDAMRELSSHKSVARWNDSTTSILTPEHVLPPGLEVTCIDANKPPRTWRNPPYFQAQSVMRALALMPGHMLRREIFRELSMEVLVGRTRVGWVLLTWNQLGKGLV